LCARLSGRKSFAQLTPSPTRFTPQSISPWPRRKTHRSTSGALPRSSSTSPLTPIIIETREGLLKGLVAPSSKWIGQSSNTTRNITSFIDLIWIERFSAVTITCVTWWADLCGEWMGLNRGGTTGSRSSRRSATTDVEEWERPVRFEEKSTVALSTGTHLARPELWPKHIDGGKKNYEEMMRGIVGAVRMISISGVRLRN
jgi:hypothetical protein